jgi:ATP-binding cassette subfamily B (MDR/TAP) protein 8
MESTIIEFVLCLFQAAKATSVGEEAISNIRTVRAFAMENQECELFCQQSEEASRLNQHLGFGIGLFQVEQLTN